MWKLSCNRFRSGNLYVDIVSTKNAVELKFEQIPQSTASSSGNITVTDNCTPQNYIVAQDGQGQLQWGNPLTNYIGGALNPSQFSSTTGFRFFMRNGYLKCVRKDIPHYVLASVATTTSSYALGSWAKNIFSHPSNVWDWVYDTGTRKAIEDAIVALAARQGVEVPRNFVIKNVPYHVGCEANENPGYCSAALDWLAYPLIREIGSVAVSRRISYADRNLISPGFEPMNFKQLVEHYYGTSTSKMLEELWKVIAVGGELRVTKFDPADIQTTRELWLRHAIREEILELHDDRAVQIGDRSLQAFVFNLGPAILKTMGFDYFYQAIPHFGFKMGPAQQSQYNAGYIGVPAVHTADPSMTVTEFNLTTLLKYLTPKKLLSVLFSKNHVPDTHHLQDTAEMLRAYDSVEKIPKNLRLQYPLGLTVDFKFKTLKELHDKISTQFTIIKTEASRKEIPVTEIYEKLDGLERDGCRLIVPRDPSILAVWGKLLNICIASYGDRAVEGNTLLLGVEKEGSIKYCIEFRTIVINRPKLPEIVGGLIEEGKLPEIEEVSIIREPYPRLLEKQITVVPTDVSEEEAKYVIPSMAQFRGERNCDPDKEDRHAVENLLIQWAEENLEFLKKFSGIFDDANSWSGGLQYGGALDQAAIYNAINQIAMQDGRPDQILMNPQARAGLVNMLNGIEGVANADVQIMNNEMNVNVQVNQAVHHIPIDVVINA